MAVYKGNTACAVILNSFGEMIIAARARARIRAREIVGRAGDVPKPRATLLSLIRAEAAIRLDQLFPERKCRERYSPRQASIFTVKYLAR